MSYTENRALLRTDKPYNRKIPEIASSSSEDWSSSYSSDSSLTHSGSDDSYIPDWESHIDEDGSLFYLEYNAQAPNSTQSSTQMTQEKNTLTAMRNEFNRISTRRSKKSGNKFSKLINRQGKIHKELATKKHGNITSSNSTGNCTATAEKDNKVKFNEFADGEIKELTIFIDPTMRHRFGRRTSVAEALLGISICPFPNSQRIMVAGYMPNSEMSQDKTIKIGDWLKAINDQEVTLENFDFILTNFVEPTNIKLQLQRIAVEEQIIGQQPNLIKIASLKEFAVVCKDLFPPGSGAETPYKPAVLSVMYLRLSDIDEQSPDGQDVLFCYPPKEFNNLFKLRGTFLTLNSLFGESTFKSKPTITTVKLQDINYYVSYNCFHDELLLIALSSKYATIEEAKLKSIEIVRCLEFINKTIPFAFHNQYYEQQRLQHQQYQQQQQHHHQPHLNQSDTTNNYLHNIFAIITHLYLTTPASTQIRFEESLMESHYVPLPKEAQLRIDDALSEMEAMDYREWNDDPLNSHREFYILGSALYFKRYLLASHLPPNDLLDIEVFLRVNGVLQLIDGKTIRDLVIWREIYPKSVERGLVQNDNIYGFPKGRWYLAIIARNQMLLAVILESRHLNNTSTSSVLNLDSIPTKVITPSPFYIEEIQDTLDHLRSGGIENLANTWINCNKRPQIIKEVIKDDTRSLNSATSSLISNNLNIKKTEIISILKRRNNSAENVGDLKHHNAFNSGGTSSVNSQTFSDGSLQKYDEDDDGSDSDWDGFPDSQRSSSGFDMSDMTGTLLKEVSDVIPSKITAGKENILFYYVQVEVGEGVLLAPTNTVVGNVIQAFRKACLLIHNVLQNTIRFRYLLSQESSRPNSHRSLVAIKEHGVLISTIHGTDEQQIEFWVIGRLFSSPPKELYVCHRADAPQNLVELAFRLSLHSAG